MNAIEPIHTVVEYGEHPKSDAAWRLYVEGNSSREIGKRLGFSHVTAWTIIKSRTEALKEINSPEHKAACVGLLLDRYSDLYKRLAQKLDEVCDAQSIAALTACAIRVNQAVAEIHGLGKEMSEKTLIDHHRLEEVSRRIALTGPHSKASRAANSSAFRLAGITPSEQAPQPEKA